MDKAKNIDIKDNVFFSFVKQAVTVHDTPNAHIINNISIYVSDRPFGSVEGMISEVWSGFFIGPSPGLRLWDNISCGTARTGLHIPTEDCANEGDNLVAKGNVAHSVDYGALFYSP